MIRTFEESQRLLARALQSIPLGAQTFSKSPTQYPAGISPHFAVSAKGAELTDVDGNVYLDFVNALAAVLIGYADDEINAAISAQLEKGISFSLSNELEIDVAERLCKLVPCAEQVRFGKNGSDATTAAIRLARACTERERIAVCGYHGWHDWYIGTTSRNLGVPEAVRELSHSFRYNDIDSLDELLTAYPHEFAAVIMEPFSHELPGPGFLEAVAEVTRDAGALLIFDETITGFRVNSGGAQGLTGVIPDLATFGKGIANGLPLSAIVGPRRYMSLMEKIFFSTTFGGETLSLAAARAVLDRIEREAIPNRLAALGNSLKHGLTRLIESSSSTDVFDVTGHPSWTFLRIAATARADVYEIKTLLLQEMLSRGILFLGTHNLSAAHTEQHISQLLHCYEEILPEIAELARAGRIGQALRTRPLEALFSVR